jgi:DNA-directed RNA polymerase subunit H (RpoH/RPB5)
MLESMMTYRSGADGTCGDECWQPLLLQNSDDDGRGQPLIALVKSSVSVLAVFLFTHVSTTTITAATFKRWLACLTEASSDQPAHKAFVIVDGPDPEAVDSFFARSTSRKALQEVLVDGNYISDASAYEVWAMSRLQFDLAKHRLVPLHEIVPPDTPQHERITRAYGPPSTYPTLLRTDPMARWLGARAGDLVRVTRISPTSGTHVTYRFVRDV